MSPNEKNVSPTRYMSTPAPDRSTEPNTQHAYVDQSLNMMDFAKYMARRELVTTGLTKFEDQPENFRAWESSFLTAIHGLDLSATEQLDLLVKWLGKESSEHAKRIRAVHVSNPPAALHLIWVRLEECYATPEIIESALFRRLASFPSLSPKENTKLRELGDLLTELQSAKEDGYLPGLSYLDTPRGINPIVEKLPTNLQDKWITAGSRYKEEYRVTFPPFSFFTQFVCTEARKRNDPSFILPSKTCKASRNERPFSKHDGGKTRVTVNKTHVSSSTDANGTETEKREGDLAKHCPIHNKPHPLTKCRAFKTKTIAERKACLKEHRRCYKCCSPNHMAKECQVELKCNECESDRHCTALHPDIHSSSTSAKPKTELGSEDQHAAPPPEHQGDDSPEVTTRCTRVCGPGLPARSCSKICLAWVYPRGQRERSVKMYVVLDDQSNRSLARSEFYELFEIQSSLSPYVMRTCAGITEMTGRKAVGFQIEALDTGECFDLPPLIECNEIMTNRAEIPTPEVALSHTHLKTVAPHLPKLDPDAEILLLLGRDIIRVHKVRKQINGPHNAPFAQCLDLGWVIVGEVCINNAHNPNVKRFWKTNTPRKHHHSKRTKSAGICPSLECITRTNQVRYAWCLTRVHSTVAYP